MKTGKKQGGIRVKLTRSELRKKLHERLVSKQRMMHSLIRDHAGNSDFFWDIQAQAEHIRTRIYNLSLKPKPQ